MLLNVFQGRLGKEEMGCCANRGGGWGVPRVTVACVLLGGGGGEGGRDELRREEVG